MNRCYHLYPAQISPSTFFARCLQEKNTSAFCKASENKKGHIHDVTLLKEVLFYVENSVPLPCLTDCLTQLPHGHCIMRAVVITGDGVEIRQTVPILEILAHIQAQQAGFLIIAQRTQRAKASGFQGKQRVLGF